MKFRNGIVAYWISFGISFFPLFIDQQYSWILGLFVFSGVLFFIPILVPNDSLFGKITSRFNTSQKEIWLTIDDGPHPESTPQILDLLDQYQARATFFIIGREAQKYPELIREIIRRGHTIGNHTQHHLSSLFWMLGPSALRKEVQECQKTLKEIAPETLPHLFRAPVGMINIFLHPILQKENLLLVGWSVRGYDTVLKDPHTILQRLIKDLQPGAIVLLHEGKSYAHFQSPDNPLEMLLIHLQQNHYQCILPKISS